MSDYSFILWQMIILFSVSRWLFFYSVADDYSFFCEQMVILFSVSRWLFFFLWADGYSFFCEQMIILFSVSRWLFFFLWADGYSFFCEQMVILFSVSWWLFFFFVWADGEDGDLSRLVQEKSFCVRMKCHLLRPGSKQRHHGHIVSAKLGVNTLRPRENGRYFTDHTFKCSFLNENVRILIKISLKFVPKGPVNNIPSLVQIMAWCRPGDKPLSELMVVSLLMHVCVTLPQWVEMNNLMAYICFVKQINYLHFISHLSNQSLVWYNFQEFTLLTKKRRKTTDNLPIVQMA